MKKTILAVDDDPEILTVLRAHLERAGYRVETASNGEEALDTVHEHLPDLIILDISMPVLSGFDVVRELRSDPSTIGIPVIMLTARTAVEDVAGGIGLGADVYLTKPFRGDELLSFVERMLPAAG